MTQAEQRPSGLVESAATVGSTSRATSSRDNNFNLLRFALATLVLLSHSPELVDGDRHRELLTRVFGTVSFGELAVDGFFLLSGFLIVQSWQRTPEFVDFFRKRILRIYPGFIVASLISALIVGPLGSVAQLYFSQLKPLKLVGGILVLHTPFVPPVFAGQPDPFVNGPMWTIKFEFLCYSLVAVLGICGIFRRRTYWLSFAAITLLLSFMPSITNRLSTVRGVGSLIGDPLTMMHLISFFCIGGCFYLFRDRITYKGRWALAAFPLLVAGMFQPNLAQLALASCGAYLLFWFAFKPIPALKTFRKFPDVSYGVYLYGWPIQKLLLWYIPSLSPWLLFLFAWFGSCLCGWLSWHLVERPFLRLKPKPAAPLPDTPSPKLSA